MKLYRVMKVDADGKPRVGPRGFMLGVRPTDPANPGRTRADVAAATDQDEVGPGEGLSTFETEGHMRAKAGEAVFEIDTDDLGPDLECNPDRPPHALIQPAARMTLAEYQTALADTRDLWTRLP